MAFDGSLSIRSIRNRARGSASLTQISGPIPMDLRGPSVADAQKAAQKAPQPESAVHHPPHYGGKDNVYETVKIEEALGLVNNHYRCSALEYFLRAGKKDPSKLIEDLEKGVWWIQREIAALKKAGETP